MSVDISTVSHQAGSSSGWVRSFSYGLTTILMLIVGRSNATGAPEEAIDILTGRSSNLDELEWAERYLCGMADHDRGAFMKDRKWQS